MTEPFIYPVATLISGVDEVGRGMKVGAVVAAAGILAPAWPLAELVDLKKPSEKRCEALYEDIIHSVLSWSVGRAEAYEIDQINIFQATLLAMPWWAVVGLAVALDFVLVDGNRCPLLPMLSQAVVKGHSLVTEISVASIIAKVTLYRKMAALHQQFPEYGFAQHKAFHLRKLAVYGSTVHRRRSFTPVRRWGLELA